MMRLTVRLTHEEEGYEERIRAAIEDYHPGASVTFIWGDERRLWGFQGEMPSGLDLEGRQRFALEDRQMLAEVGCLIASILGK